MARTEPYDARTLRYVAAQLDHGGRASRSLSAEAKAELIRWGREYRLEANRVARAAKKKRKGAGAKP